MANNLVISYDLYKQGQNYDRLFNEIKSLGVAIKAGLSYWYVSSNFTSQQAATKLWAVMDSNDRLIVVDAKSDSFYSFNLNAIAVSQMQRLWS